ncbi:MAG: hypothetical protein K2O69_04165 [Odoribacter sp.]|nr:hypothetical protein [Odoribacter sp.]
MMYKNFLKPGGLLIITILFLSTIGCNKDYYDVDDIRLEVETPDTIYIGSTITIKGTIEQPLDIKVYWQDLQDEHFIGTLKPHRDSLEWKVENVEEGANVFSFWVSFETKRNHEAGLAYKRGVIVKKKE